MLPNTSAPLSVEVMTGGQLARRERLTRAVVDLVAESGADSFQMKDVADRSGVALGTAYRYFASKDHLLAVAMSEWQRRLTDRVIADFDRRGVPAVPVVERVLDYTNREIRGFQRHAHFAGLMVRIYTSTDPFASEAMREISRNNSAVMERLLADVPDRPRAIARNAVESVLMHALTTWVTDRCTIADVFERVTATVQYVLAPERLAAATGAGTTTG
ncbi:TetR/AcrR family transcriptional regulator [Streptodolium elevatio]|uniref:TetR/AcrR family transcriptional regulator n=1 Tax=Streptodolium elevatio TaxID=3157996 RepID=A0ABV3DSS0_9ACTN